MNNSQIADLPFTEEHFGNIVFQSGKLTSKLQKENINIYKPNKKYSVDDNRDLMLEAFQDKLAHKDFMVYVKPRSGWGCTPGNDYRLEIFFNRGDQNPQCNPASFQRTLGGWPYDPEKNKQYKIITVPFSSRYVGWNLRIDDADWRTPGYLETSMPEAFPLDLELLGKIFNTVQRIRILISEAYYMQKLDFYDPNRRPLKDYPHYEI
jgi:hypothetical protein